MAVYVATIPVIIFIAYLTYPWQSLFSLHPIFMSVGFLFFMVQANTIYNTESSLVLQKSSTFKNRLHWIFHLCGFVCFLVAFISIYAHKSYLNKPHFSTWHGTFGTIALIYFCLQSIGGILIKYNLRLRFILPHVKAKIYHATNGVLTFLLMTMTFGLGIYSSWFQDNLAQLMADQAGQHVASYFLLVMVCSLVYVLTNQVLKNYSEFLTQKN